jgi:hypothetical protein
MHPTMYPAVLSALMLSLSPARGDAPGAIVEAWEAPPECPSGAAVERQARETLLGSEVASIALTAQGIVTRVAPDRWRVDLTLRSGGWEAHRSLGASTCDAVSQAAAVVIALAVNLEARAPLAPKPEAPEPRPSPPPSTGGASLGLGPVFDFGSLPRGTAGLEASAGLSVPSARFEVGASYFLSRSGSIAERSDVGATFRLVSANVRACYELRSFSVALAPCLDGGLAWTSANGFGNIAIAHVSSVGLTVGADVMARWLVTKHLAPYVRVGGLVPLARPEFAVQGLGTVYQATPIVLRGGIGIEAQFD